jgi:hypothetical protein
MLYDDHAYTFSPSKLTSNRFHAMFRSYRGCIRRGPNFFSVSSYWSSHLHSVGNYITILTHTISSLRVLQAYRSYQYGTKAGKHCGQIENRNPVDWSGYETLSPELYLLFGCAVENVGMFLICGILCGNVYPLYHRAHTEWQRPLSDVHSIMMEKLAQACEGGGCTPTPFHYSYQLVQSCSERSSLVGRYTHPQYFISINICTLCVIPPDFIRIS